MCGIDYWTKYLELTKPTKCKNTPQAVIQQQKKYCKFNHNQQLGKSIAIEISFILMSEIFYSECKKKHQKEIYFKRQYEYEGFYIGN